ncbi:MAG: homoserine dehydrogenase [Candidatus Margulisbacteria bacterium]|nr:homoserine dehydrogenase [Candidatus Margulisiibacteriota bacterium]
MTASKPAITLGLIGFGNVGQGVHEIVNTNQAMIAQRLGGQSVNIKTICVRTPEKYKHLVQTETLTNNPNDIFTDPDIDIVVEVIGGEDPAYDYIVQALSHKKHVVTANKELIAKHKKTFFELAKQHDVDILFEASVGGGIPIIKSFKVGYSANQMQSVYGILNGTTNYILTKLFEDQQAFDTVLKDAQALGFAEADPTADVSGLDAAYKIVILTAVALKLDIQIDDVFYQGIDAIQLTDIQYLNDMGFRVKLIAKATRVMDKVFAAVYPTAIPVDHPLAMVRNEFNAIFSMGNMVGESMIYGKGAGSLPTGSAVMSDILDIAFDIKAQLSRRHLETSLGTCPVLSIDDNQTEFYIRLSVSDEPGALEKITNTCSDASINISKLIQKERLNNTATVVILTSQVAESAFNSFKQKLKGLSVVHAIDAVIRVGL